jgi:hypothetical protein
MAIAAGGSQARRTFATSVSPEKSPGRGAEMHVIGWLWGVFAGLVHGRPESLSVDLQRRGLVEGS